MPPGRRPSAVSLFTGMGGADLGLIEAGCDIVFANDNSRHARSIHLANLPETEYALGDVAGLKSFPTADLLVGGYPCTGFSQGGARDSKREICYLYRHFDRALRIVRPAAFIVENVAGLARSNFRPILDNSVTRFRFAGYRVQWRILDAAQYGVPQRRKRLFIVGVRSGMDRPFEFPAPTCTGEAQAPLRTVRDALQGMPEWPEGDFLEQDFHWWYMSRNRYCPWDEPSRTILSNARHMPLHPISPPMRKLKHNVWAWEREAPARRFSVREAARLQGMPADWSIPEDIPLMERYKAVGNAVPPGLIRLLAEALLRTIGRAAQYDGARPAPAVRASDKSDVQRPHAAKQLKSVWYNSGKRPLGRF